VFITTRDLLGTAADELAVGPFRTVGGRFIPNERGGLPWSTVTAFFARHGWCRASDLPY
jgi:hypothetical protein